MVEFRLKSQTKVNELNMIISDYESKEINKVMNVKDLDRIMEESKADISNVKEAKERIDDLLRVIKSKNNEIERLNNI
jgi:hypothetical protein